MRAGFYNPAQTVGHIAVRDLFGRKHTTLHLPGWTKAHEAWQRATRRGFVQTRSYTYEDGETEHFVELTPAGIEARDAYFAAQDAGKLIGRAWKGTSFAEVVAKLDAALDREMLAAAQS